MVLVSEPVRGRSRATELPCFYKKYGVATLKHVKQRNSYGEWHRLIRFMYIVIICCDVFSRVLLRTSHLTVIKKMQMSLSYLWIPR